MQRKEKFSPKVRQHNLQRNFYSSVFILVEEARGGTQTALA
jgi:hypothetical protein